MILVPAPVKAGGRLVAVLFDWGELLAVVVNCAVLVAKACSEVSMAVDNDGVLPMVTCVEGSLKPDSGDAVLSTVVGIDVSLALYILTAGTDVDVSYSLDDDSVLATVAIDVVISHSVDDVIMLVAVDVVQVSVVALGTLSSGELETLYATETLVSVVKPQTATASA